MILQSITLDSLLVYVGMYGNHHTVMHLSLSRPPTPGRARVGIIGNLQESFNKFPTPGANFMLQIPYILYRDSKNNEDSWTNAPTLGTKYADKSLQIPTHCPTWGRWGLTICPPCSLQVSIPSVYTTYLHTCYDIRSESV